VGTAYLELFVPPIHQPIPESATGQEVERRFTGRDGKSLWVSSRISVLRDAESNRLLGCMDVSRDISARKKAEQELHIAQRRVTQTARLAAIGELASGVAHHINNPLTAIIAEAHLLLQSLPAEHAGRESAQTIEQAGWRVQEAVQSLLDFSRPPSSTLENINVNHTIEEALTMVGDTIRASGIQLQIELGEGLASVYGNARQLGDLWVNLLLMARDATPEGTTPNGKIGLSSFNQPPNMVAVEISDDGKPIPAEDLEKLFKPDYFKPLGGRGTGIELSICQEIVRQHHGQITVESKPGHGTIFRVLLGGIS
jgi:two-component system, NtrC family, sensor kinase